MFTWWNSISTVETAGLISRWIVASAGIAVLVLAHRLSVLQYRAKKAEKEQVAAERLAESSRLAEAEAKLASTERKLQQTSQRAMALQETISPRKILTDKQSILIEHLKNIPKSPIRVIVHANDDEITDFAGQITSALNSSGFPNLYTDSVAGGVPKGVSIIDRRVPENRAQIESITDAFNAAGIGIPPLQSHPLATEERIYLFVGSK